MPELPEVHTTVVGLNQKLKNKSIRDVWSSYDSDFHAGKNNIKNVLYFKKFRAAVVGAKFVRAERRGKNILIHLSNAQTILIHMKMTGHCMYGSYELNRVDSNPTHSKNSKNEVWRAKEKDSAHPLNDPFNQHIRLVFTLSDGKQLVFSDMRKFGKVFVFPTSEQKTLADISDLGPEPLSKNFTFEIFESQVLKRPKTPIKQVLLDQTLIAGIGNIYSDEMLWSANIHPLSAPMAVPKKFLQTLFKEMRIVLEKGIDFGGDSESDYRNINGLPGDFQNRHHAYRHTGQTCDKRGCTGIITRLKIGGRSAHFCPTHQILFKK